jgi:putative flippase GtrA
MRFIWVNLFGAALAWAISSIMARHALPLIGWTWHPFEIAHLCGVAAPAVTSYFLHKHYTFAIPAKGL